VHSVVVDGRLSGDGVSKGSARALIRVERQVRHARLKTPSTPGRVRPDGTALWSLALVAALMPVAGLCLLPVALAVHLAAGVPLWVVYGLWCASAVGYGLRPVQRAMARLLWPIRRPTPEERGRLEHVWNRVVAHAGVSGRRFRLLVVDLSEVNAHSIGRDLICVTTGALGALGDRELAGVLAHELGHHLRMHTSASAFLVWVLLPLQGVALVGNLMAAPIAVLARRLAARWPEYPFADACARGSARAGDAIRAVFAAPGVAAFAAKNAAGRSAEYRVDAFAVEVGLGAELLSALRWFAAGEKAAGGRTAGSAARGTRARHAAVRIPRPTHPPLDRRMERIAARVEMAPADAV
jgi:Zn-dependent protease with chaperone function